jgi:hypothetical protein
MSVEIGQKQSVTRVHVYWSAIISVKDNSYFVYYMYMNGVMAVEIRKRGETPKTIIHTYRNKNGYFLTGKIFSLVDSSEELFELFNDLANSGKLDFFLDDVNHHDELLRVLSC